MAGAQQIKYTLKGLLFILISILGTVSQAGSTDNTQSILQPSLLPLSQEECRLLNVHRPSADVAFQPGVALDGAPVAPADLPGPFNTGVPGVVSFYLLLRPQGPGDLQLTGSVGALSVDVETGAVTLNGTRIDERQILVRCSDTPPTP